VKALDLTGERFGNLTVIESAGHGSHGRTSWLCRCDCGKEIIVATGDLRCGHTKSCGCSRKGKLIHNLVGKRFGKLVVLAYSGAASRGRTKWECKCDCGNIKIIMADSLSGNKTVSCGCYRKYHRMNPIGVATFNLIFGRYRKDAEDRGYEFSLSEDEFKHLIFSNCAYCGKPPSNLQKNKRNTGDIIYNGIDRVDSSKGYTLDNVVACCKICNRSKRDYTVQEFKDWLKQCCIHLNLMNI
jgi:hypothetical protein